MSDVPRRADEEKIDFVKATLPRLAGGPYVLPTLKYLKLRETLVKLSKGIEDDIDPTDRATIFLDLMSVAGVEGDEQTYAGLMIEVIEANPATPILPWQMSSKTGAKAHEDIVLESQLDYTGRELADVVATLASIFGWTPDYILGVLTYAEVILYMQEALLIQQNEINWHYMFSEVGFKKEGSEYVKVPLPVPEWMNKVKPVRRPSTMKVPERFLPTGFVIDYTKGEQGEQYDVPPTADQTTTAG